MVLASARNLNKVMSSGAPIAHTRLSAAGVHKISHSRDMPGPTLSSMLKMMLLKNGKSLLTLMPQDAISTALSAPMQIRTDTITI